MITNGRLAKVSVYPPCTSLRRMCCLYRFSRLMKSISYALSARLRIPTPPASTKVLEQRRCGKEVRTHRVQLCDPHNQANWISMLLIEASGCLYRGLD